MALDKEIKFIATANTQIKFYNKNVYRDVFRKIEKLLVALKINIEKKHASTDRQPPTRRDIYLDDDWFLSNAMHSVTIRSYNHEDFENKNENILTLKCNEESASANNIQFLKRMEYHVNLTNDELEKFTSAGIPARVLKDLFPHVEIDLADNDVLIKKGEAYIRRSIFMVSVDERPYQISVDKFYFLNSDDDKYSETFTEIEIESKSDYKEFDEKIRQLVVLLQCMLDIELQPVSKYHRFREFSGSDEFEEFYFLGIDLVAYSQGASWKQKQVVQRFHKILKDCILTLPRSKQPIMISIGDGAIIAVPSDWANLERLMKRINAMVAKNNATEEMRKIEYRSAVHYGSVFRFTDLNDAMNVAGEGINVVSRVLAKADSGQSLFSEQAYKRIIDANAVSTDKFLCVGESEFKHGLRLNVYEYKME